MAVANTRDQLLAGLRQHIAEVTVAAAAQELAQGAVLIDVRDDAERAPGTPAGALGISRGFLELRIAEQVPDRNCRVLALCGSGQRSLFAAETLQRLGYADVASVAGGYAAWLAAGLPVQRGGLDADSSERYSRHLLLPEVGVEGQSKLAAARVVLIGAGGLGSPAALYLAAAGVGRLRLVDDDRVERSNLQRQVLHADARVGMRKTESARIALLALNPRIELELVNQRLLAGSVEECLAGADVVIDGADNFPTRYLLDAACRQLRLPLVYGAIHRFTGQVSVFDARQPESPCYRCLFPEPPSAAEAPNCAEAGVLGVLPGTIGLLQATEAIKLILGLGSPLTGRLLCYDALAASFRELRLRRDPACPGCGADALFTGYEDIAQICANA
ncbi:molybdopterin/thiamine biosynthesis adenylyltransferase [Tahibacter aquaticus]|uniref:Molybdopterin-synthase adenylyltransferase n=1 Tax=Tahibacter aquaticus TaxID=520092 RepID=A0A4V6PY98_9GAMM|nr:molybdopterin-synthase adenylyltransferase MoeB [Tahibacter aquaticus]TDR39191.1 molybdopterin/thiamine biosynthesis adenylyltransferase [Tahibacter aquaticus]